MLEPPKNIEPGHSLAGGLHSKVREILAYLERSRLIPGYGIHLVETPCGIAVSAETGGKNAAISRRKKEHLYEYTGPWGLWIYNKNSIHVNPGLVWTPDGAMTISGLSILKPSVSSLIVFGMPGGLSAVSGDLDQWETDYTDYWNTHALLGRYDAENDIVVQYQFSPIVYLIETETLIIEPT